MKFFTFTAAVAMASVSCAQFPLEWNVRNVTGVPYEVEISPAKLERIFAAPKDCSWQVVAKTVRGEERLRTDSFDGKAPGTKRLRFRVPSGTISLKCVQAEKSKTIDSSELDNLFAGALAPENVCKWKLAPSVSAKPIPGGINFRNVSGDAYVTYTVDVPDGLAGRSVVQEIDLTSRTRLAWGGKLHIAQLDSDGRVLADCVADPRWTSHMRPTDKFTRYRDAGRIHPRASKLRLELQLRCGSFTYDSYGLPISDQTLLIPEVDLTHVAVRPAIELPFPKWNDAFFTRGVSGEPGDEALVLGGDEELSMFYQFISHGGWASGHQFRVEEDRFFPSGDGTVEVWLKPEFTRYSEKAAKEYKTIFQAYQDYRAEERIGGKGEMLGLAYSPALGTFRVTMKDWELHAYSGVSRKVEFPSGKWTHVALQWNCFGVADLYVNGRKVFSLPIPEFRPVPLSDLSIKYINDRWAMELYLGAPFPIARDHDGFVDGASSPYFEGAADELRVSTGRRYSEDFVPARDYRKDAATRALFKFDRSFDGVSSGGYGHIPACVHAKSDRVEHRLAGGYYWAKDILPENDYDKVLDIKNYANLPTPSEYRESRVTRSFCKTVRDGERVTFTADRRAYPEYVEYSNRNGKEPVMYPILVGKGRLDPRSFGDLRDTVAVGGATDRAKVDRVFQYVIDTSDYFHSCAACFSPGSDRPTIACYVPMLMLNSYCGFNCGPLNYLAANLFATAADCPASPTVGYGHSFEQVFYDGKNHIYDLSAQKFFPAMDNETAAYLEESENQPGVHFRTGGSPAHFIRMGTRHTQAPMPGYQEKVGVVINPGEKFRVNFANDGQVNNLQCEGPKAYLDQADYTDVCGAVRTDVPLVRCDRLFPQYSTGVISFDGVPEEGNPAFERFCADSFCYRVSSPNPIVWAEYAAYLKNGKAAELEISTDFGKTYSGLPRTAKGVSKLEYRVKARQSYLVRVKAPVNAVSRFTARTECMVNTRSYPAWVQGGGNEFVYRAVSGPAVDLTLAWREPSKEIVVEGGALSGTIPGFERELHLLDPEETSVLEVKGVSPNAVVRSFGRLKAKIAGGKLTVRATDSGEQAVKRGVDLPGPYNPKTYFAWVDIVDGSAVKRLAFVVAPNARLVTAEGVKVLGSEASFRGVDETSAQNRIVLSGKESRVRFCYKSLPAGKYTVFALVRFPVDAMTPQPVSTYEAKKTVVMLHHPTDPKLDCVVASPINPCLEYMRAIVGCPGGLSRWKWDTAMLPRKFQGPYGGWLYQQHDLPTTDHLDFSLLTTIGHSAELAAVLIVNDPDIEFRLDLRRFLCGVNSDPAAVQ